MPGASASTHGPVYK